jgi:outer membrane lipoprotein-sorting protein
VFGGYLPGARQLGVQAVERPVGPPGPRTLQGEYTTNGTEKNDSLGQMLRRAMPDDIPAAVEERLRNRLTAFHERFNKDSAIPGALQSPKWLRRKFIAWATAAAGVAAVALLLTWMLLPTGSASAMEKMAENILKAKSFKAVITGIRKSPPDRGRPDVKETTGILYWRAPGWYRYDLKGSGVELPFRSTQGEESISLIKITDKPTLILDHKTKSFFNMGSKTSADPFPEMIEKLGDFSGQADRDLGTKEVNGKKAHGFEIDIRKLFPKIPFKGMMEIWLDRESNLPVLVRSHIQTKVSEMTAQIQDFQWNIELHPKLFDITPPEDYSKVIPPRPDDEGARAYWFADCLRQYVKLTKGPFPQLKTIKDADAVHKELRQRFGFESCLRPMPPKIQRDENFQKAEQIAFGLLGIVAIQLADGYDAAYYGKTVGPADKDKVLLRYKRADGQYMVIFGNLSVGCVPAECIPQMEGKSK